MIKMKSEESKKASLYLVTGVGCSPISIEKTLLSVMTAEIIQDYAIRLSTADWYYHKSCLIDGLKYCYIHIC